MKAVGKHVLITEIKIQSKTASGLLMGEEEDSKIRYKKGEVISFGDEIRFLKEGDIIHYDVYAGHSILTENGTRTIIKGSDIVLID